MDRLIQLENIYRGIASFMAAEEKSSQCSEAVIIACRFAKSAVYKEYYAIVDKRKVPGTEAIQ